MSLKDFQIQTKLGSGSFGIVYKARRREGGEILVLKEVQLKKMNNKMREWALNEAKIMKSVPSPYLVKYFQSFVEKEKFYICMEYCSGGDLSQFLKGQLGKPVPQDIIWKFTIQIMLGLRDLHARKILHRDIKTMNVFLGENKSIKIGDLGVARTMTGDFASTIVGTPYYLSPQMCEEKPYNQKTDIWAMGCLVYELCTGKHPFQANSQAALALKIVVGKYNPIPGNYSQTLVWLVKVCLSVDYKRRPSISHILQQQDIINISKKIGLELAGVEQNIKPKDEVKQIGKIVSNNFKEQVPKVAVKQNNLVPKKNDLVKKQPEKRVSVDKKKSVEKIIDKNIKNQKKEVKQPQPMIPQNRYQSVKDKPQPQPNKKIQIKQKPFAKQSFDNVKLIEQKKQQLAPKKWLKNQQKILVKVQGQKAPQKQINLLVESKPKKSVQQIVDDDQLFNDFGITPQKITVMDSKIDLKKVNTINWNIMQQRSDQTPQTSSTKSNFIQLPTIKTPSSCEIISVQCKQLQGDEDIVEQQIDDNQPYKSDDQKSSENGDDTLLLEDLPEVEEVGELKKKQNILLLQKKIYQNQRRKRQLTDLKNQYQSEIVSKMNKAQYDKVKSLIKQDNEAGLQKMAAKQLSGVSIVKFIKIYHYEIQIERCLKNIEKWQEKIVQQQNAF